MPATYTKSEIENLFGKEILPKSTIQLYTDRKVVEPVVVPERRGLPRKYDATNLVELLVCRKMVDVGFTIDQVRHTFFIMRDDDKFLLDPAHYGKSIEKITISLIIEYTVNGKVRVNIKTQAGTKKDVINVQMKNKDHVRIINISGIIRTVQDVI